MMRSAARTARLYSRRYFNTTPTRAALVCAGVGSATLYFATQHAELEAPPLFSLLQRIDDRLRNLEGEAKAAQFSTQILLEKILKVKETNPTNLCAKHFSLDYFDSLPGELKARFLKVIKSGAENADSGVGVYAMYPDDYEVFKPYMDAIIREYHKIKGEVHHVTNWSLAGAKGLPEGGVLDLTKLGLSTTSMRVRVGRNLAEFPLPGAMTKENRVEMEERMVGAFKKLIADPKYGGTYHSLTPGSKYQITEEKYKQLVNDHIMFKDMAADPYLASAGISSSWPYGRGCYVSEDRGFIVWVGEEDHLRIMCMKKGTHLNDVFDRLKGACGVVEDVAGKFAHSPSYGYVTSCPTNLGTGMRASVHIALPKLTKNGKDVGEAKKVCKDLGLSVRGIGGEHTDAGEGGIVDISPSARLQIQESEIICALYGGIKKLMEKESSA